MNLPAIDISKINKANPTKIGTAVGFGVGAAYLLKNKQDVFVNTLKNSVNKYGSKKYGILKAILMGISTMAVSTGVGAAIGKKITDSIKLKNVKQELAEMVSKSIEEQGIDETHEYSVGELEALLEETENE